MKNRLFALLLTLVMMLTYMPAMAFAAEEEGASDKAQAEAPAEEAFDEQAPKEDPDCSEHPFQKRAEQGEAVPEADPAEGEKIKKNAVVKLQGAYSNWTIGDSSIYMSYNDDSKYLWIYGEDLYDDPVVTSSNKNVIFPGEVEYMYYDEYDDGYNYRVPLYREGGGKATITVSDSYGNRRTCSVTVGPTPSKLNKRSYSFDKKHPYDSFWIYNKYYGKDRQIVRAKSSKKKVASVKVSYGEVCVTAKKKGKTTISVTDRSGKTTRIKVSVSKGWKKANLKYNTSASVYYATKKAYIYSKPHTTVRFKIGGKTYKKKTNKYGSCDIKLKKRYKLKTKFKVTVKKGGVRYVYKGKVESNTYARRDGTIYTCNNYIPVTVENAVKGDMLYVSVNGKTYKKKITNSGTFFTYIWTDGNLGYTPYIKYKVRNKYKQTLYSYTEYISWS